MISLTFTQVQTYLANELSSFIFKEYDTEITIRSVAITALDEISFEGVYVEDLKKDTLFYASELSLELVYPDIESMKFRLQYLKLKDTKFYLKQYAGDTVLNLQFIIDRLTPNTPDTSATPDFTILGDRVILENIDFKWVNENDSFKTSAINFSNLHITGFNFQTSDVRYTKDSILARIEILSFKEKSGFELDTLSSQFRMDKDLIALYGMNLQTSSSAVSGDFSMIHNDYNGFRNFIDSVIIKSALDQSHVNLSDLAYFTESLQGAHQEILLRGDFEGVISDFSFRNMGIGTSSGTMLFGNLKMKGLPDVENSEINLSLKNSRVRLTDVQRIQIPPYHSPNYLRLPEEILRLGTVKLDGSFNGTIHDFKANSKFNTSLGRGKADLTFHIKKGIPTYDGLVSLKDFGLGKLIQEKDLGALSMEAEVFGSGLTIDNIRTELLGFVSKFSYKGYDYQGITVDGFLEEKKFIGFVEINEKNADISFDGSLDFSLEKPKLQFRMRIDSLYAARTHLIDRDSSFFISGKISTDLIGVTVEDVIGDFSIDSLVIREKELEFTNDNFLMHSYFANDIRRLEFSSPIFSGILKGNYQPGNIASGLDKMIKTALPTVYPKEVMDTSVQVFSAYAQLSDLNPLLDIFYPDLQQPAPIFIRGFFDSQNDQSFLDISGESLIWKNMELDHFLVKVDIKDSQLVHSMSVDQIVLNERVLAENIKNNVTIANDTLGMIFSLARDAEHRNRVYLDIQGSQREDGIFRLQVDSNYLVVADSSWNISKNNTVLIDTNRITVQNFNILSSDKYLKFNGVYSEIQGDELFIYFKGLDLGNMSKVAGDNFMNIDGALSGFLALNSLKTNPHIMSDIKLDNIVINDKPLGTGVIESYWNHDDMRFEVDIDLTRYPDSLIDDTVKALKIMGYYYPQGGDTAFDFHFSTEGLYLHTIEPIVSRFIDNIDGKVLGSLELKGGILTPKLVGELEFDSAKFRVAYLNTNYLVHNQTLRFEDEWFGFDDLKLLDDYGQSAKVVGTVYHENWRNMNFDVAINADKFLALNTTAKDNELFYGTTYLTGDINVSGYQDNIYLEIYAKTDNNSIINIPAYGSEEVDQLDYITFVKPSWIEDDEEEEEKKFDLSGISMLFDLDIDPSTRAKIIFDEVSGDMIETKGTGQIKMTIDQASNFAMYGNYEIVSGTYHFSYENLLSKKFRLQSGGKITWTGDPLDAYLDLVAIYDVKAAIGPLLGDTTQTKKIDNECLMYMSDKLTSPDFNFDIRLKNVGQDVESQVKSQMPTQEEVNKQFFSLLIFNKYSPPESNFGGTGGGGLSSEMIANQLNLMISKLNNDIVDIGFSQVRKDNVEVAVSKNLMNDRLIFESNVGVDNTANTAANNQDQSQFVGDFKLEYLIKEDGRLRAKVFNRTESVSLENQNSGSQTQGIGLFFRHDFESYPALLRDIFTKKSRD